ncbi:hypothetical protein HMPREF3038_02828 [Akkermansia sp. KLE1797]|nr:hypothetical protein HMPREF3038_02828 [Akkermansia sp. KLE1797]KXU52703.1 hypothetical protein HMPREF3039_03228 [Akkermansia sp. KLE1798]KZA04129.1 hypothetical protein HMPREF1326_02327 [Akkermansia sp. KLE1605]
MEDTPPCQTGNLGTGPFWHYHHWRGHMQECRRNRDHDFREKGGLSLKECPGHGKR